MYKSQHPLSNIYRVKNWEFREMQVLSPLENGKNAHKFTKSVIIVDCDSSLFHLVFFAKITSFDCRFSLLHSGLFSINFAHFSGNFWDNEKSKNGQKIIRNGPKRAKKV